jgi:hypothetical protein
MLFSIDNELYETKYCSTFSSGSDYGDILLTDDRQRCQIKRGQGKRKGVFYV